MRSDPPLTRWEKRIGWAWMITGGTAAAALWLGVFGWWGILIVTIPVLLFALIAPGLFLYMTAVIIPLLLTRRRNRPAGRAVAAVLVLALAILPPWLANRSSNAALAAAVADDRGAPVTLPRGGTLALLGIAETCTPDCLAALRDKGVAAVLIGDGWRPAPASAMLPRVRLVPSAGRACPAIGKTDRQIDWIWPRHAQELADAGLCGVIDVAPLASADLVMRYSQTREGHASIQRVEAWAGGARLLRRTRATAERAHVPGVYLAPSVGDIGRGAPGWWHETVARGSDVSADFTRWWR